MSNSGLSGEIEPQDADPEPSTSVSSRRLFYTRNTAEDFFRQFNEVLDRRDRAFEASIHTLNETIATLAASVDRLVAAQRESSSAPELPSTHESSSPPVTHRETTVDSMEEHRQRTSISAGP